MYSIENICKKISIDIGAELKLNDENVAVINYGLFAVIQILISIILAFLLGAIFNVVVESLIILCSISILRQSSGGVHASSPSICTAVGTILSVGMAIVITNINIDIKSVICVGSIIFAWSYYIIFKLAPVDSAAKPIKTEAKRKRLKRSSISILSVYFVIVIGNIIVYYVTKKVDLLMYSGCIYIGLLWQVFSLTKSGHVVLGKLDAFLNKF